MPTRNDHAVSIPADTLAQARKLVDQLAALLKPYATPLTSSERHDLSKMGDKTLAFVDKAHELAKANPDLCPAFLDVDEFSIDFADTTRLVPLLIALRQLADTVDDIQLLAGSEAYDAARAFYKYAKVAAGQDVPGAKAVYEALRERFPYPRRRAATAGAD
jgi:hypothetical protein